MREHLPADKPAALATSFPLGRIGQPEDIASAALFPSSNASSWITGTTLDVASGKTMI